MPTREQIAATRRTHDAKRALTLSGLGLALVPELRKRAERALATRPDTPASDARQRAAEAKRERRQARNLRNRSAS